jgi:stage II sporulation protein AA (anti-sigma F factor antagonist)
MLLDINTNEGGFKLSGELDMASADALRDALAGWDGTGTLLLDVSELRFMDSSGLRVLLEIVGNRDGDEGTIVLLHPTAQVKKVLDISIPGGTPGLDVRP